MSFSAEKGKYLNSREFAEISGVKLKTVHQALQDNRISGSKMKIEGKWYFHSSCVIIDRRIKTGKYIGIRRFIETGEDIRVH